MSRYRCDCGDTECPSCGSAQGTWTPPHIIEPSGRCEVCDRLLEPLRDPYLCASCLAEVERIVKDRGE